MITLASLLLGVAPLPRLDWSDLQDAEAFALAQEITFEEQARFVPGARFRFEDVMSIPYTSYFMFDVRAEKCADPGATHEVVRQGQAMVELQQDCLLVFYVDGSEYYAPSVFTN